MKLMTSLFTGIFCLTLGACQQMPNAPSGVPQGEAATQAASGFGVTQVFGGGAIGFGGGFAAAPAPIAAPVITAPTITAPAIRTPINNVPIATDPIPATSLPVTPFPAAPPLTATAPSIPAAPLPAAPLTATAPITTAPAVSIAAPLVTGTTPAAAEETDINKPLPVAPPVGPGSNIPPPGIGFGYTNTYTSTLEDG